MWNRALAECTPERWRSVVRHTEAVIDQWYARCGVINQVPDLIIHIGTDSTDSDDMDSD